MASATTIRKKLFNNHYEETAKKLTEVQPNVWRFLNRDEEVVHYSSEFDIVYHHEDTEYVLTRIEEHQKEQQERQYYDSVYQKNQLDMALNSLVNIACFTYGGADSEHPVIIQLNNLCNKLDAGEMVTMDEIRIAMVDARTHFIGRYN